MQGGLEKAAEVFGAHSCQTGKLREGDGRSVIGADVFQNRLEHIYFPLQADGLLWRLDVKLPLENAAEERIQSAEGEKLAG